MFTGIIQGLGLLKSKTKTTSGLKLEMATPPEILSEIKIDDSIATEGVCLTCTGKTSQSFYADVAPITLKKTLIESWQPGRIVNLELALRLGDRIGGHLVSGHIQSIGVVIGLRRNGEGAVITIRCHLDFRSKLQLEGSVALNGISLTVATLGANFFSVSVIPHTFKQTSLKQLKMNQQVHLESDQLLNLLETRGPFKFQRSGV